MGNLSLEIGGQIDDIYGVEGAFLRTDTATDAQRLRDEGDSRGGLDFDAELARPYDGAGLFTFLPAFLCSVRTALQEVYTQQYACIGRLPLTFGLH
jgi:hypothetical protein